MSLSPQQRASTIEQFDENLRRLGLTPAQVAHDLGTTEQHLVRVANLDNVRLEDPWILRNHLLAEGAARGIELVPFTALVGDHHDYWFLDGAAIDRGRMRS